jgi:hypothetical protein
MSSHFTSLSPAVVTPFKGKKDKIQSKLVKKKSPTP